MLYFDPNTYYALIPMILCFCFPNGYEVHFTYIMIAYVWVDVCVYMPLCLHVRKILKLTL